MAPTSSSHPSWNAVSHARGSLENTFTRSFHLFSRLDPRASARERPDPVPQVFSGDLVKMDNKKRKQRAPSNTKNVKILALFCTVFVRIIYIRNFAIFPLS